MPDAATIFPYQHSIDVSANIGAILAPEAGGIGVESKFPNGDHDVIAASGPVKAVVRVQSPLITPSAGFTHLRYSRSLAQTATASGRSERRSCNPLPPFYKIPFLF